MAHGGGPSLGALGDVARGRIGAAQGAGAKPRGEPVDQAGQLGPVILAPVKAGLDGAQVFNHRGGKGDEIKAKARINPLEPPLEKAAKVIGIAAGAGGDGAHRRDLAIGAKDAHRNTPCAKPRRCEAAAELAAELWQPSGRILHRLGEAALHGKARRVFAGAHRLGQTPHDLIEPQERVLRQWGAGKAAGERDTRDSGEIPDPPKAQPLQKKHSLRRKAQRRHRQGSDDLRQRFGRAEAARRGIAGQRPGRAVGGRGGGRGADPQRRELFLHRSQHRRLAAHQVVRAGGVHHQPRRPARRRGGGGKVGGGPRAPAPRPENQPVQRGVITCEVGVIDAQFGAERPHVDDPRSGGNSRLLGGAVGGVDHRPVRAFGGERLRDVFGRGIAPAG